MSGKKRVATWRDLPWEFRPAATGAALRRLKAELGPVPAALLALYRDHDGTEPLQHVDPWRLMSIDEAIDLHPHPAAEAAGWVGGDLRVFWTDDNSNYAGLYVAGPLKGCVAFLDHDDMDLSPVFVSLDEFLSASLAAASQETPWHELAEGRPAPAADDPAARKRFEAVRARVDRLDEPDDDERMASVFVLLAVTPVDETATILPFLDDEDMFIQERACEVLGARRFAPAATALRRVARTGMPNGRSAAKRALARIRDGA